MWVSNRGGDIWSTAISSYVMDWLLSEKTHLVECELRTNILLEHNASSLRKATHYRSIVEHFHHHTVFITNSDVQQPTVR